MKVRLTFWMIGISLFLGSCGFGPVRGSGKSETSKASVAPFTKILIDYPFDTIIQQGGRYSLEVTADHNVLTAFSESVNNKVLTIKQKKEIIPKTPVRIRLISPDIEEIIHSGTNNIHLKLLDSRILVVTVKNNGSVTAEGSLNHLILNLEGNGSVNLAELNFHYAEITAIGKSNVTIPAEKRVGFKNYGGASIQSVESPQDKKTCINDPDASQYPLIQCL